MVDNDKTLAQLKERMAEFVAERDWGKYHSPKNLAMGVAIETGELLETDCAVKKAVLRVEMKVYEIRHADLRYLYRYQFCTSELGESLLREPADAEP